ncbi:hypothetical protein [Haloarchaeobius sp. DFWS5]|uniref:hypothetical protein n=1 Tax=Haloarchaeobius sp. DFWS5 TaxID=3446114 RepID=UPI003EB90A6F
MDALPTGETLTTIAAHLDDPDPQVRSYLTVVVRRVLGIRTFSSEGVYLGPNGTLLERYLALADDTDWRVRQNVINVTMLSEVVEAVVAEDAGPEGLHARLASVLVDGLTDPVDIVRKRAGELLVGNSTTGYWIRGYDDDTYDNGAEVFLGHPNPAEAVGTLLDALADPVDDFTDRASRGRSPRRTAGVVVASLGVERPDLLEPHRSRLVDALDSDDPYVRKYVSMALVPSLNRWSECVGPVEDSILSLVAEDEAWKQQFGVALLVETLDAIGRESMNRPGELIENALATTIRTLERETPDGSHWVRTSFSTALTNFLHHVTEQQGQRALADVERPIAAAPADTKSIVPGVFAYVSQYGETEPAVGILSAVIEVAPAYVRSASDEYPDSKEVSNVLSSLDLQDEAPE